MTEQPLSIDVFSRMEPLETQWRALEHDNYGSLHQSYDWCHAWVETHNNPLAIVRGQKDGRTVFILPLEITRQAMVSTARWIAARFSNINTGLFDATFRQEQTGDAAGSLGRQITDALNGRADLLYLSNIPLVWRQQRHPLAGLASVEHQNHAFQLPLLSDFTTTIAQLNAKRRRKKYRNQHRKLEEHGGFEHIIATAPDEKTHLLELFFQQKAARFAALGLPNVFHEAETQAFFHRLQQSKSDGLNVGLQLHAIRLKGYENGKIAAIAGLSRKGDHVICQFGSIDAGLVPEASPGELLFWLMIEQCCAQRAALFDFGLGDQGYKRGWCPVETVQHDMLLPITPIGHGAASAQRLLIRTKAAIKDNPQLYAMVQKIRARYSQPVHKSSEDET
ncbi:CelD/BcsL family acetyltransferase involved in cellulose biosynthesis [Agrobacterium vitis]|nr:CelD/BcsL family acetyltransferase involved in cellulose biosynthesis [Agrobacterium vitis]MBE1438594.1 CelD/BcsL family acetyltransferase involved in cellulose biosynthesis [Agrobacterium vitis]